MQLATTSQFSHQFIRPSVNSSYMYSTL